MANKYRNEKTIKVAGEEILLRPDFQAMAEMQTELQGGLNSMAEKIMAKKMLAPHDATQIIYICQTPKRFSKEEINQMTQYEGIKIIVPVTEFIANIVAGNKEAPDVSEEDLKKN